MIKCLICGLERKMSIAEHLIKTHKIKVKDYKETYKAEVKSLESKNALRKYIKEKWADHDFRQKMIKIRKAQFTLEVRDKMSKTNKEQYKNGRKTWCFGLTKETHPSLIKTGLKNKEHLTGRTKEHFEYLRIKSELFKEKWRIGKISNKMTKLNSEWMTEEEYERWRCSISNTLAEKYKTGELRFSNEHFKYGKYKEYNYDSGLELEIMKFLDSCDFIESWQKDFDVIPYLDECGKQRNYVPDFRIVLKNKIEIVIESKGYDKNKQRIPLKEKAALEKYPNYFVCYSLKEIKDKLYEINKNKFNR